MRALLLLVLSAAWRQGPPMNVAREDHTATALRDGGVLVMGGRTIGGVATASAERFDDDRWYATGNMAVARERHTATLLPGGQVLVVGGSSDAGYLASAELYDPATGTWSSAGQLTAARASHTATLLADGRVLVTGGFAGSVTNSALDTVEVFEPPNVWTRVTPMSERRMAHVAALLLDGRVLVAGGRTVVSDVLTTSELFNPDAGTWQRGPDLTLGRALGAAVVLPAGYVLIAGGSAALGDGHAPADLYLPDSGTFIPMFTIPVRFYGSAVVLRDGRALIAGGSQLLSRQNPVRSTELLDLSLQWRDGGMLLAGRSSQAAVLGPRGQVLLCGGHVAGAPSASVELYDPKQGAACSSGLECGTGLCVDGVCCDTPCSGPCESCNLPQAPGTCTPVSAESAGSPPCTPGLCPGDAGTCRSGCASDVQCALTGFCSGGVCLPRSASATPCDAGNECLGGFCSDGVCCNAPCSGKCDVCNAPGQAGTCVVLPFGDEGSPPCAPYVCSGESNGKCRGTCTNDSHCVAGKPCVGGVCGGTAPAPAPPKACGCVGAPGVVAAALALALLRRRRSGRQ